VIFVRYIFLGREIAEFNMEHGYPDSMSVTGDSETIGCRSCNIIVYPYFMSYAFSYTVCIPRPV
jgi:hypothetical protein